MQLDMRGTPQYRAAEAFYKATRQPGAGSISDAADVHVAAGGKWAVFAGTIMSTLESTPSTRICLTDLSSGETRVLTTGPNTDCSARFSPDSRHIAFLSDSHEIGDFQLYVLELASGAISATPRVEGWVEYLHWSPDGHRILLGVAGHGADVSGGQGAVVSQQASSGRPSWMPSVETGDEDYRWRRAWVYEPRLDRIRQIGAEGINVWEAVWCGNEKVAAVVSPGPNEGLWYTARLTLIEASGDIGLRIIDTPRDQIGLPSASPSGTHLAIVEAVCSDRGIVAGDLKLIDIASGEVRRVNTAGIDVSCIEWRTERRLLVAGHRGFQVVVGLYDSFSGIFTEVWSSRELGTAGRYISVSGFNDAGDCALLGESFTRAPEIAVIRGGQYHTVRSFDLGYADEAKAIASVECVRWTGADGREMQGWVLRPRGEGPYPLIMNIHGGPVWSWHPLWLGRPRYAPFCLLLHNGYAVFFPNPRGSSGRGQDFARQVVGDMGGGDAKDLLSGIDHLVKARIADPKRLGVTGVSYGGFMTAWLITQDSRFAAAVAVCPITNQVTEHLLSNISYFVKLFLDDNYTNPSGQYFRRSPIMHACNVKTPTLNICGAMDRCTPPAEAMQMHNALLEHDVESVLITYPEEGHGIHNWPAAIDFAARMVLWFDTHLRETGPETSNEMRLTEA